MLQGFLVHLKKLTESTYTSKDGSDRSDARRVSDQQHMQLGRSLPERDGPLIRMGL